MKDFAIFRTEKLKQFSQIAGVANHNHRLGKTPNANPQLKDLNQDQGTGSNLVDKVKKRHPAKVRKNAVLAFESIFTFSPEWWQAIPEEDREATLKEWRDKSLAWAEQSFGGSANVVDWVLHRDETTPHLHAVIVPIDSKGKLNCRHFLGGKETLSNLQTSYAQSVESLGLKRGIKNSKASHRKISQWYGDINQDFSKVRRIIRSIDNGLKNIEKPQRKDIFNPVKYFEREIFPLVNKSNKYIRKLYNRTKNSERKNKYLEEELERTRRKHLKAMSRLNQFGLDRTIPFSSQEKKIVKGKILEALAECERLKEPQPLPAKLKNKAPEPKHQPREPAEHHRPKPKPPGL